MYASGQLLFSGWHIPCAVKDAPNVYFRFILDTEDQIRKSPNGPETQAGIVQLMSVTRRATLRLYTDFAVDNLKRIDDGERNCRVRLGQIVLNRFVDVTLCLFVKNNRLGAHCRPASWTSLRRLSK